MQDPKSLWSLIPKKIRLSLIPLIGHAFLVNAGPSIALLLNDAFGWGPSPKTVNDISACLLFLNFCLSIWIIGKILMIEQEPGGKVEIEPRLLSLVAAFLTIADLFKIGVADGEPAIFLYGVFVMAFLFFIPFILIRIQISTNLKESSLLEIYFSTVIQHTAYSLSMAFAGFFICTAYFVIMNDGIIVFKIQLVSRFIKEYLNIPSPQDFWIVNPAALSIAIVQVACLQMPKVFKEKRKANIIISKRKWLGILLFAFIINSFIAIKLIGDGSLLQGGHKSPTFSLSPIKALIGSTYTAFFIGGSYILFYILNRFNIKTFIKCLLISMVIFLFLGALEGGIIVIAKKYLQSYSNLYLNLIWIHSIGFMLAIAGMMLGSRIYSKYSKNLQPLF